MLPLPPVWVAIALTIAPVATPAPVHVTRRCAPTR